MRYQIELVDEFDNITNADAFSSDEAAEQICEALDERGEGSFTVNVQAFEESGS